MRTRRTIALLAVATTLTLSAARPAAAVDKCAKAIAAELLRAAGKNLTSTILKGKTPSLTLRSAKVDKACGTSLPSAIGYPGCPGILGCPKDTDTSVEKYEACVNCLLASVPRRVAFETSPGRCGDGNVDAPGEICDPSKVPSGCAAGQTCIGSGVRACTCGLSCGKLSFTFGTGTTSCGGAALTPAASAPFSGALYDAPNAGGAKVADLGLGCLYFGGGNASIVSPGLIPDGSATIFDAACDPSTPDTITLTGSDGTSSANCTKGPGPTAAYHCASNTAVSCTVATGNVDCKPSPDTNAQAKACQPDAKCYFGPPLSLPNHAVPVLSACVVNVLATDAAGTANPSTGEINLTTYLLTSLVYLTGVEDHSCPACVSGVCGPAGEGGQREGLACTSAGSQGVTLDCPPLESAYLGALSVNLAPLSTGSSTNSTTDGLFCTAPYCLNGEGACDPNNPTCTGGLCGGQQNAGAFGKSAARTITETGAPAGDLRDHAPHSAQLAYTFCIPPPGEPATSSSDLPGPGAVSLQGTAQLFEEP